MCGYVGIGHEFGHMAAQSHEQFGVDTLLQNGYSLFRTGDGLLILLEFFRDVAFRLCEGLLADPFGGHLLFVGVAHFEIVAEHVVEAHLQGGDAGLFGFALLQAEQVVFPVALNVAQAVELFVHTVADVAGFVGDRRGVGSDGKAYAFAHLLAECDALAHALQLLFAALGTQLFDGLQRLKGVA